MTEMTKNGVSTTTTPRTFKCERYKSSLSQTWKVQWDYRDSKGKLHTGIAASEEEARLEAERQSGENPVEPKLGADSATSPGDAQCWGCEHNWRFFPPSYERKGGWCYMFKERVAKCAHRHVGRY